MPRSLRKLANAIPLADDSTLRRLGRFVDDRVWCSSKSNDNNICKESLIGWELRRVTVFLKSSGRYGVVVAPLAGEKPDYAPRDYETQFDAKVAAFELVEMLIARTKFYQQEGD